MIVLNTLTLKPIEINEQLLDKETVDLISAIDDINTQVRQLLYCRDMKLLELHMKEKMLFEEIIAKAQKE